MKHHQTVAVVLLVLLAGCSGFVQETDPNTTTIEDATTTTEEQDSSGFFSTDELNRGEIEDAVHQEINERREEQGLQPLQFDEHLRDIARSHSENMGDSQFFSHTAPDGSGFEDRYSEHGYSCRVSVSGNQYATGAENIAYTYANERIRLDSGGTAYYTTEQEIAEGLVNQWMNSTGHRENILRPYWQNEGVGIYITEVDGDTRVYATQNFC